MSVTLLYPYVTLDDVKRNCGIDLSDTEYDDKIKWAINKASRYIDSTTGRYFYKVTYTNEYLNGQKTYEGWRIVNDDNGGKLFTPKLAPIISVTEIVEDDTTLVENTDFYIHASNGYLEKESGNWNEHPREIKITCELGYDSADTATPSANIPGDIARFALEIASRFSGRYVKTKKDFVTQQMNAVELYGVPKDIEKQLQAMRPVMFE